MSSNFTSHFSADDAAPVLIDFQPQMFVGVDSHDRDAIKNNLQVIAKSAKLFKVPTVLSTVTAKTFAGGVTSIEQSALTTLLANPEKSCRHSSDYHRLDNARYPTCTRNDGRSRCLRSGLLTAVSVNRDEGRP